MLSKNQTKLISSLKQKKYRQKHGFFVVEGEKSVKEFVESSLKCVQIFSTLNYPWLSSTKEVQFVTQEEMARLSLFSSPSEILALFEIPQNSDFIPQEDSSLILALDGISDPGNLGTIIRLCDWFGISEILCSPDTVDCYNPKVVQATMGSLTRVKLHYCDLEQTLPKLDLPVFGAMLQGENLYQSSLPKQMILLVGNEANGIRPSTIKTINTKISIPRFGSQKQTESLNVAMATGIILGEFFGRKISQD
ncbi:MAG: RNA methyltransferase [Flavobacteriaceae bacterium]|nr:MAG: RNA methyltransferase [Flavobacteriaceae bacterium]